ncbi:MAG: PKD domain-containing protein [Bacteroidales bacterium]|nr:PKD domain-containing protein [Bacteroidales bacterium]
MLQSAIALTGTPPWNLTSPIDLPVVGEQHSFYPLHFPVRLLSPPATGYSQPAMLSAMPADSIHGLASITVIPLPDPFTTSATNNGVFCEGDTGVVISLSSSQTGMIYSLLFNGLLEGTVVNGTGSPISFGVKNTPGQYSIRGVNPLGNCIAMMNDTVTVIMNPIPVTDFTTTTVCNSDTTFFTVSGNFTAKTSQWHWNFGDGTFAIFNAPTDPWHVYPTYGTYTVTLSVEDTNNCTYSISHPVEVRPHPTAFFTYSNAQLSG